MKIHALALMATLVALTLPAFAEKFPYGKKSGAQTGFTSASYTKKVSNVTMTVDFPEFEGCPELNKSIKSWLTEKCKYAEENYTETKSGTYSLVQSRVTYSASYISVLFCEFISTEESIHPYMARKSFVYNTETKKMVKSASELISEKDYKKALNYVLKQKDTSVDDAFSIGIPSLDELPFMVGSNYVSLIIGGEYMYGYAWAEEYEVPVSRE